MDNYSLTEAEFNDIGKQAFIDWFNTIREHIPFPYNKPAIDVGYRCDGANIISIMVKTPNTTFVFLYDNMFKRGEWSNWNTLYSNGRYKSPKSAWLAITSFNRFIEIEKTRLIAKPYGEDIAREIEELFF